MLSKMDITNKLFVKKSFIKYVIHYIKEYINSIIPSTESTGGGVVIGWVDQMAPEIFWLLISNV